MSIVEVQCDENSSIGHWTENFARRKYEALLEGCVLCTLPWFLHTRLRQCVRGDEECGEEEEGAALGCWFLVKKETY